MGKKTESRSACIDLSSSAPWPFSNFRSAGILCKPTSILTAYLTRRKTGRRRRTMVEDCERLDELDRLDRNQRFVFNGCHRTTTRRYPDWEPSIASPKMPLCLGWPILLLPIFRLVGRARESILRRNRELLSQESFSRCSSFTRSKMSSLLQSRTCLSYRPLFSFSFHLCMLYFFYR